MRRARREATATDTEGEGSAARQADPGISTEERQLLQDVETQARAISEHLRVSGAPPPEEAEAGHSGEPPGGASQASPQAAGATPAGGRVAAPDEGPQAMEGME